PSNLNPNISVAAPTARYTKIAVPRNSTANFRIIACPPWLMPTVTTVSYDPSCDDSGYHDRPSVSECHSVLPVLKRTRAAPLLHLGHEGYLRARDERDRQLAVVVATLIRASGRTSGVSW